MHRYTVVAFHPKSKGIVIYIFPKNGIGKGIVLNNYHDIVPQVIGRALIGVSHDKDIRGNATQTHNHTQGRRNKREKEQKNKLIYPMLSQLELRLG